jgi:RNA polymerase sigma factor (sigma-70 family)
MIDGAIKDLLGRLGTPGADAAWREFLDHYSPLILQTARRYAFDQGGVMDLYVHVCDRLSDDGFRRLRRFRTGGRATFRTWLTAVTANLCIDWRRQQRGRLRPLESMAGLPSLDRLVYRNLYVRGMAREECLQALRGQYPDLDDRRLAEINARLFKLLSPRQRWQVGVRAAPAVSIDQNAETDSEGPGLQIAESGPGPEDIAQDDQARAQLRSALASLSPQQRLLLRLRYEQNLTLEQVARLTGLADPFRAHRQIQAALKDLRRLLTGRPSVPGAQIPPRGPCEDDTGAEGAPVGNA